MFFAVLLATCLAHVPLCSGYCMESSCWPSDAQINTLKSTLTGGDLYKSSDSIFSDLSRVVYNTRYTEKPALIALPRTNADVQKCVLFANEHNLRITVVSSGHDYIGRNTGSWSFQLNMENMTYLNVNLNDSTSSTGMSATTEMGNNWGKIYKEVSGVHNKLIVGGSSETVHPAGYTMGGGHSPLTRMLGLAVDNVLEITAVTAQGYIVTLTDTSTHLVDKNGASNTSSDTDLFWALRGGGGSTFAVVTRIKYKIHNPPADGFVYALCSYRYMQYFTDQMVGKDVLEYMFGSFFNNLPNEFGGYLIFSTPQQVSEPYIMSKTYGLILVALEIFGSLSYANTYLDNLKNHRPDLRYANCNFTHYNRWWDYRQNIHDKGNFGRLYIFNSLIPTSSFSSMHEVVNTYYKRAYDDKYTLVCTAVLIGGKPGDYASNTSSVGDGMRNSMMSLSCALPWVEDLAHIENDYIQKVLPFQNALLEKGNGVYYNEPPSKLSDWRTRYWGSKYSRLDEIKKKWDPESRFTCCHCVGAEGDAYCSAVMRSARTLLLCLMLAAAYMFTN